MNVISVVNLAQLLAQNSGVLILDVRRGHAAKDSGVQIPGAQWRDPALCKRFIDKDAEFLYVPAADVMRTAKETGATPYDVPALKWVMQENCAASTPF